MAMALQNQLTRLEDFKWVDDVLAVGSGFVDGALIDKAPIGFLIKNLAIPIIDKTMIKLPKGLVYHAEGQLGLLAYLLLFAGEEGGE